MPNFSRNDFPPLPSKQMPRLSQASGKNDADVQDLRTADAPATINDLPDELLLGALHFLPGIDLDDFQLLTLVSLSRTNRRFHRLVAERLYPTFDSHFCEPYLFLRTVVSNSYLAGLIRHANLTYGNHAHQERKRYIASAQDKKIIKDGLRVLNLPDWKAWATECNENAELDTLYTAILMHTPNVSSVKIFDGPIGSHRISKPPKWPDVMKKGSRGVSFGSMHRFQHLQSLHVKVDAISLAQLASSFRMPQLRELRLLDFTFYDADLPDEQTVRNLIPRRCNNLKTFHLGHGFVQPCTLQILLASSKCLEVFEYDLEFDMLDFKIVEEYELGSGAVPSDSIISALQCQKNTIVSLTFKCDTIAEPRFRGAFTLYEGFKHFPKLKNLFCPLGTIVNTHESSLQPLADKIPPYITALHFVIRQYSDGEDKMSMPALEQMVDAYAMGPPSCLKELKITIDSPGPWFKYGWSRIVQPLSQTGVAVVIEEPVDKEFGEPLDDQGNEPLYTASLSSEDSDEVSLYSD